MRILHITCNYLPDSIGGTEVYVSGLCRQLKKRGNEVFVSFIEDFYDAGGPRVKSRSYEFEGIHILVIQKNGYYLHVQDVYFSEGRNSEIYKMFIGFLDSFKPDIVHFHHFVPSDTPVQVQAAKDSRIPVVLTYHTPAMTCLVVGKAHITSRLCDGKVDYNKCLVCMQVVYGLPRFLARLWAALPRRIAIVLGQALSKIRMKSAFLTWLELPWLLSKYMESIKKSFILIDYFVAVSDWVYKLLLLNGVPANKIILCRQGVVDAPQFEKNAASGILRLGYLGRIDPVKGIDVLLDSVTLLPDDFKIEFDIYGDIDNNKYFKELSGRFMQEKKVKWRGRLDEKDKFQALSRLDALVIPSIWQETGPLVLLEAWAVGIPVIGADVGSIIELVKEGQGGLLFKQNSAEDLARIITNIYQDRRILDDLRAGIPKVRTMAEVAEEMSILYRRLKPG